MNRFAILLIGLQILSACSSAKKQGLEEAYSLNPETVRLKADQPIYRVWDRWSESVGSGYLLNGDQLIALGSVNQLLQDDPSPLVRSEYDASQRWKTATGVFGLVATGALIWTIVNISNRSEGKDVSDAAMITSAVATLLTVGATAVSIRVAEDHLDRAIAAHNSRIWKSKPSAAIRLQWNLGAR